MYPEISPNDIQQVIRPIGASFLTITNGIILGVAPILGVLYSGNQSSFTMLLTLETALVLLLSFLILIAAIVAWKGHYYAGVSLVGLLAVRFLVVDILPWIDLFNKHSIGSLLPHILMQFIPSFLWVVLNGWYFLPGRPKSGSIVDTMSLLELSAKVRALHAILGMVSGLISFDSILLMFVGISTFISDALIGNTNVDEFMGAFLCAIPALIISLIFGLIGGHIGYRYNEKYIGSIIGGLLGPVIALFPLSVLILSGWLR